MTRIKGKHLLPERERENSSFRQKQIMSRIVSLENVSIFFILFYIFRPVPQVWKYSKICWTKILIHFILLEPQSPFTVIGCLWSTIICSPTSQVSFYINIFCVCWMRIIWLISSTVCFTSAYVKRRSCLHKISVLAKHRFISRLAVSCKLMHVPEINYLQMRVL